jgi:hypothetical protein
MKLFLKLLIEKFTIIFIDESCFNFYYDKRRLWHNKELLYQKGNVQYGTSFKNKQFIIATTFDKIIYYELFTGINDSGTFNDFLNNLFKEVKMNHKDIMLDKTYFYLDNSRIHDCEMTYNNFKKNKLKILWGVNNYSNFDFCEFVFRPIKVNHYKNIYTEE